MIRRLCVWLLAFGVLYFVFVGAAAAGSGSADNVVFWYDLSTGSGATAVDSGDNGLDGTISGAAWSTGGPTNLPETLDFDGTGDVVTRADSSDLLDATEALTINWWMKTTQTGTSKGITDRYVGAGNRVFRIYMTNGQIHGFFYNETDSNAADFGTTDTINDGNNHMITVVVNGNSNISYYIDADRKKTVSLNGNLASAAASLTFGDGNPIETGDYDGLIAQYTYLNESWSQEQITSVYESGNGKTYDDYIGGNVTDAKAEARDVYTGGALTNFTVTFNGTNYTTSNGTVVLPVLTNTSSLWNLTYYSNESGGYFSRAYTDIDLNVTHIGRLHQVEITFNASNRITGASVVNFTANTSSNGGSATVTAVNPQLNLTAADDYSFQFRKDGFYPSFLSGINVSALEQSNDTFTVYDHKLNVTINVVNGSVTDQNFTADVYGRDSLSGFHEKLSTTNGFIEFNLTDGNYTVYINDSIHALTAENVTLNSSVNLTNLEIDLFSTNSVQFNLLEADTGTKIIDRNVSVFVTGSIESYSFVTDNGTQFLELIEPDSYTVTYSANGYFQGEQFFTLTNRTTNVVNLYLVNESESEITATVVNELTATVEGVIIKLQRKNLSGINYYETDACITSPAGTCILHANVGEVTYRAVLSIDGVVNRVTGDFKFTTTTQTFRVNTAGNPLEDISELRGISTSFTGSNNSENSSFTLVWDDVNGNVQTACISVANRVYGQWTNQTTCSTGASGSLTVVRALGSAQEVCGNAFFLTSDGPVFTDSVCLEITSAGVDDFGVQGVFLYIVFFMLSLLLAFTLSSQAVIVIPVVAALLMALGYWIGLVGITGVAFAGFLVLCAVVLAVVYK